MQFVYNDRKTAQVAAQFLKRHGGRMPYIKLIKLMYLADRESLVRSGYPITGDRLVSMDHGPVLSRVLDLITWGKPGRQLSEVSAWREYISDPQGYDVQLVLDEPSASELSEFEIEIIDQVFERFGHWDRWRLVDYTHSLPEWEDPAGTSVPIDARAILAEAGQSDEEIREVAAQVEAIRAFRAAYS